MRESSGQRSTCTVRMYYSYYCSTAQYQRDLQFTCHSARSYYLRISIFSSLLRQFSRIIYTRTRAHTYVHTYIMSSTSDETGSTPSPSVVNRVMNATASASSAIVQKVEGVMSFARPYFHYGFVPLVIYLGVRTGEPRPSLLQLISPL